MRGVSLTAPTGNDDQSSDVEMTTDDQNGATTGPQQPSALSSLLRQSASSAQPAEFRTTTLAPSPPSNSSEQFDSRTPSPSYSPGGNALRISTDVPAPRSRQSTVIPMRDAAQGTLTPSRMPLNRTTSASSVQLARTPSTKAAQFAGNTSTTSSPVLAAMGNVTPLPSPLMSSDSPGPWKKLNVDSVSPPQRRDRIQPIDESPSSSYESEREHRVPPLPLSPSKRKPYISSDNNDPVPQSGPAPPTTQHKPQHTRNRSVSEYQPEPPVIQKRNVTVSGSHANSIAGTGSSESTLRRETNLAESRGLTPSVAKPPTPPPSESSRDSNESTVRQKDEVLEYFKARGRLDRKQRRWRSLGLLGRGTFSRVMLATSQVMPSGTVPELTSITPLECRLDRRTLVAVKVCEHGPRGGASEDRVEMSLKRELEIMQVIHHPSLVDLKAFSIEPTRAILVMSFCPGGDLFDVATTARSSLTPGLIRRMFSELVMAVQYLHKINIVHRDVKLENVLVNIGQSELSDQSIDWASYPYSVITLADMGLSRRVGDGEQLETRCGSDDYAAPEVIMGQSYDGKATDAWSLGVLLYALLEARLPFDPHPGMSDAHRMRSRTSHRIARVEWRWVEFAGEDGDHEGNEAKFQERGLRGAMYIVEGLLKRARSRWTLGRVAADDWVSNAICVDGGLRFRDEDQGEEVS